MSLKSPKLDAWVDASLDPRRWTWTGSHLDIAHAAGRSVSQEEFCIARKTKKACCWPICSLNKAISLNIAISNIRFEAIYPQSALNGTNTFILANHPGHFSWQILLAVSPVKVFISEVTFMADRVGTGERRRGRRLGTVLGHTAKRRSAKLAGLLIWQLHHCKVTLCWRAVGR